jgi:hypothetical protein
VLPTSHIGSDYARFLRPIRWLAIAAMAALCGLAPPASADIAGPGSTWLGLPGLDAAHQAPWVRALAYGTPPNVVYAGLEGGGVFKSTTGGASWTPFNSGFANPATVNVRALLTSGTGTTVFAGTDSGLFKSSGGAWQPLAQGPEDNPAQPKKLNHPVQSLVSLTAGPMLAGVFSGGVYKSSDGGATWSPPAANSGMPSSETVYGLTENIPGLVYATAGSGVYVSLNQGSTWTRKSDGIPASASPITTWAYPERPQVLFTSTSSNGIYRSINAGLTWAPENGGLGASRARGFQVLSGPGGAHLYAATENGLWDATTSSSPVPPPLEWHHVTSNGLVTPQSTNTIMWALTEPKIPGVGGPGLIAGTQSNGGYFLAFQPPGSACPGTASACPTIVDDTPATPSVAPRDAKELGSTPGTWSGTGILDFSYQWQRCQAANASQCFDIAQATEDSYVPTKSDFAGSWRLRLKVSATNATPDFPGIDEWTRYSAPTVPTAAKAGTLPGDTQPSPPGLSPSGLLHVGDTVTATNGTLPGANSDGWFNPKATTRGFQWYRCDATVQTCQPIPGASAQAYKLATADGQHTIQVRITGTNASGSATLSSGLTLPVISAPATLGNPLPPDVAGGPVKSQDPTIAGDAYVGETLAGTVGGWKDPTTDYLRRWMRCDVNGAACTYIQKAGTVDPEIGSTYVVRAGDLGYTLLLRVTADVNGDLTADGLDNHLPNAVEVDTAPSAVVTTKPVPAAVPVTPLPPPVVVPPAPVPVPAPHAAGGAAGPATPTGAHDTVAPGVSRVKLAKRRFVAGKGAPLKLRLSEAGSVRIVISRGMRGRRAGAACKPKTRRNQRRKACTFSKQVATITRRAQPAGDISIPFSGKIGKKKLSPGTYTARVVVTDAAGNRSKATSLVFRIRAR